MRRYPPNKVAAGVKDIHKSISWSLLIIMAFGSFLFGKGDVEVATNIADPERGEECRKVGVSEGASRKELAVEPVDHPGIKIRGEEKVAGDIAAKGQPFVDRPGRRVIHR